MNTSEFNDWWDYHTARFTGVAGWLEQNGAGQDGVDTLIAWQEALQALRLRDAKQATDAMFQGTHVTTGYTDHPAAVIRWCRHVQDSNYNRGPKSIYGQDTFRCHHCQDSGVRLVFHPIAMRAVVAWPIDVPVERRKPVAEVVEPIEPIEPIEDEDEDNDPESDNKGDEARLAEIKLIGLRRKLSLTCNVACKCAEGDRWSNPQVPSKGSKTRALPQFSESTMVPILERSSPSDAEIDTLVKHVDAAEARKMNRISEFDDFNNGGS